MPYLKVSTCGGSCPYTPEQLGDLYDKHAKERVCANCHLDKRLITTTAEYPKDDYYSRPGCGPRFIQEVDHE